MKYTADDLNLSGLEQKYGLPTGLLPAVMKQESAGNSDAKSSAGALGVFQFMPDTAKQYGIDPLDPIQSADGAARMYSELGKKYNGDIPSMLAAYNWGAGNLDSKGMDKAPAETRNYISSIMGNLSNQNSGTNIAASNDGNPLAKVANAVGDFLIPSAQAEEIPSTGLSSDAAKVIGTNVNQAEQSALPTIQSFGDWDILHDQKQPQTDWEEVKSPLEQFAHLAGIAGRGLAKGASMLPAAVMDIATLPQNLIDYTGQKFSGDKPDVAKSLLPTSGLVEDLSSRIGGTANNQGERLLEDATSGVGAMATGGGINSLPLLAAGAVGGLSGGTVREAGASPLMQLLASASGAIITHAPLALGESALANLGRNAIAEIPSETTSISAPIKSSKPVPVTAQDIRNQSSAAYKEVDAKGGAYNAELSKDLLKEANDFQPQTEAGKLTEGEYEASKLLERWKPLEGKPLTLKAVQEMDTGLGNLIDRYGVDKQTGRLNSEGYRLQNIQDKLQEMALSNNSKYLEGSDEGVAALNSAKQLWAKQLKMNNIEKIITRASAMEQPAQAMRVGLRTLATNPSRFRGYTPTEKALIQEYMKPKLTDEAMRLATSRLNGIIGAGTGHLGGALASHVVGIAARGGAEKLMLVRMNKILDTIANSQSTKSFKIAK